MVWVNHDPASRLSLRPLLYDSVCLPLLSPAVLVDLASLTAEGTDGALLQEAMDLQNDPALRLELGLVHQELSRPGNTIAVAVTLSGGRFYLLDTTNLNFSALVEVDPLDCQYYAPATYGGRGWRRGQPVDAGGGGAVHRTDVALLVGPATDASGSGVGRCSGRGRLRHPIRGNQRQRG